MSAPGQRDHEIQVARVTFEPVLDIELVEVSQIAADVGRTQSEREVNAGAQSDDAAFEVAKELRTRSAVSGHLLVEVALETDGERLRQVLHRSAFEMELGAGLIAGVLVLVVEREAGGRRQFDTRLHVEIGHRAGQIGRPAIEADVGHVALLPVAYGDVQKRADAPVPIAFVPTE